MALCIISDASHRMLKRNLPFGMALKCFGRRDVSVFVRDFQDGRSGLLDPLRLAPGVPEARRKTHGDSLADLLIFVARIAFSSTPVLTR